MQIKLNTLFAAFAAAGIALAATSGNAATTFTAGDLLLSFRATGGTGATSTLVVNLGQADTVYRDATGDMPNIANIGTELATTFGANWATRSDLSWGIVGVRSSSSAGAAVDGDPVRTIYASAPQGTITPGAQGSTAWGPFSGTDMGSGSGQMTTYQNMFAAFAGATTQGGNVAVIPTSGVSTWEDFNDGTISFSIFNGGVEGNFGNGAAGTALDLYRILNTASATNPGSVRSGDWEGVFNISSGGVVSFSPGAIPEPSRMMLAALGMTGLLFRRRRPVRA